MPIIENANYYDFRQIVFREHDDVDEVIYNFFRDYDGIINGDKAYVTYEIKTIVRNERQYLKLSQSVNKGTIKFLRHLVIPEQNNNKGYYTYCINVFS